MRLVLVRHGQTPSNVAGALDTGPPGAALTDLGHRQADALVKVLGSASVHGLYASDRIRTQLTAAPLAAHHSLEVPVIPALGEISAGDLEMRTDHDAVDAYLGGLHTWMGGDLDHALPGGETGKQFLERYDAAIGEIAAGHGADETVVAISHGAAIRTWVALRARSDVPAPIALSNTGCVELLIEPDAAWRVGAWTEVPLGGAHLLDVAAHDVTGEG